jgi:hypothetical protein
MDISGGMPSSGEMVDPMSYTNPVCLICDREGQKHPALTCGHCICGECLMDYCSEKVRNREVEAFVCPVFRCTNVLGDVFVMDYLDVTNREKLVRYRHEAELEKDTKLRWCPKPGCSGFAYRNHSRKLVCSLCGYTYCGDCQAAWHAKGRCTLPPSEAQFLEWRKSKQAKFCPGCRVPVEKAGGCASMVCNRCHYRWCWYCGKKTSHGHICTSLPIAACLLILFIPVMLPFIFVILSIVWLISLRDQQQGQRRQRPANMTAGTFCLLLPIVVLLAMLVTPLGFALFPLVSGFCLLLPCCESLKPQSSCLKCCLCLCFFPVGLLLGPFLTIALVGLAALCPVLGLVLLILKAVGKFCRCCGCLLGEEGYPVG